jgi:hypothetical protein
MLMLQVKLLKIDILNLAFKYNATPNIYLGRIDLKPAGYWKYEVYEVSWTKAVTLFQVVLLLQQKLMF